MSSDVLVSKQGQRLLDKLVVRLSTRVSSVQFQLLVLDGLGGTYILPFIHKVRDLAVRVKGNDAKAGTITIRE